jgi:hypothetical protein
MADFTAATEKLQSYRDEIFNVGVTISQIRKAAPALDAPTHNSVERICGDLIGLLKNHMEVVSSVADKMEKHFPHYTPEKQRDDISAARLALRSFQMTTEKTPHNHDVVPDLLGRLSEALQDHPALREKAFALYTAVPALKGKFAAVVASVELLEEELHHSVKQDLAPVTPVAPLIEEAPAPDTAASYPAARLSDTLKRRLAESGYRGGLHIVESHGGVTFADDTGRPVLVAGKPVDVRSLSEEQVTHLESRLVSADVAYGIEPTPGVEQGYDGIEANTQSLGGFELER